MLEIKNLCKTYKPKKGVAVTALDHVSLSFPEKGMVFLLGKSGSGKSTLLKLLGGLDVCDSGEIIIKGTSSASFSQKHFDSYRNTYLGFIFQEYNVLEDFSVGANIALAIELQGKKATDEELNAILHQVDLDGYGNRKPNELSGGQKQRVAIARALVKNPDIIMADEPTGALDSATGKQVLDTLKKLSREKLVIVVSHDRDFAEKYADRIIELSDGRVISDMEYSESDLSDTASLAFEEKTVLIPQGYHLTEEDREAINAYMDSIQSGVKLSFSSRRRAAKPTEKREAAVGGSSSFHLIKSRLSMKHAFKIGASGLKHKKIRLAVTILLSCIAFGLFGLSDTFGAYDHIRTCTRSILDTGISYASVQKTVKFGEGIDSYYRSGYEMSQKDLDAFEKETGVRLEGVYVQRNSSLGFTDRFAKSEELVNDGRSIYPSSFSGYSEIDTDVLNQMNYSLLCGRMPDGNKNEIAVSEYVAASFVKAGFRNPETGEIEKISDPKNLISKTLRLDGEEFEIVGVIDTHFDFERYLPLMEDKENQTSAEELIDFALSSEMMYVRNYSLMQVAMVGEGLVEKRVALLPNTDSISEGWMYFYGNSNDDNWLNIDPYYIGTLENNKIDILWIDGERKELGEKELVLSSDLIANGSSHPINEDSETYLEDCLEALSAFPSFSFSGGIYSSDDGWKEVEGYKVVGIMDSRGRRNLGETILVSSALVKDYTASDSEQGVFEYAVGAMPKEKDALRELVSYCYKEDSDIRYPLLNSVTYELDTVNSVLKVLSEVFFWIGVGFAVFASIMLANFISTSISYKKQEIGILRAIGARGNDVFRIFFSESFIIAMINFVLSSVGVAAATYLMNYLIRHEAHILITVLSFGFRQIALLFAISIFVAAIASFIPVKRIASKRPIDAIRNR